MIKKMKRWYEGEPFRNDPRSGIVFANHYSRHWTSRFTHKLVDFYLAEWRWLLPFMVACVGAVVAILKLP